MTELHSPSATAALPDTPEGCRARLATLQSEIAAIRVQIATADLRRQAHKQALDELETKQELRRRNDDIVARRPMPSC